MFIHNCFNLQEITYYSGVSPLENKTQCTLSLLGCALYFESGGHELRGEAVLRLE